MSLAAQTTPLTAALEQLGTHDHFCSIYESPQEHYAVAIPFIRIGLERGEKCIYIADDGMAGDLREAMQSDGIDVDRAISSNALVLVTKEQAYLEHGSFHPDWMSTFWKEATRLALSEGFSALRATGETEWVQKWVQREDGGLERWMEYESRLAHTVAENKCSALCQYNRRLFPPELILDVIRTHPVVVNGGTVSRNLYYVPPDEFLGANQTAREVERLLTNIRERERVDNALREQLMERRRAEEALRRSESYLAEAQKLSHTGSWAFDATTPLYWSEENLRIWGFDPKQGVPDRTTIMQRIHPEDRDRVIESVQNAVRDKRDYVVEFRIVLPDAAVRYIHGLGHPAFGASGELVEIVGTNVDVTERKQAEEAQLRLAAIVASSDDAIIGKTLGGIITSWNAGAERIFGYAAEEAVGLPITILIPPDREDEELQIIESLRRGESVRHFETVRIRKDGLQIHVSLAISPIKDATGRIIGASKIARDITNRKRAEDELRRSEASLAEAQQISHTGSWRWKIDSGEVSVSAELRRILALDPAVPLPSAETFIAMTHADDLSAFQHAINRSVRERMRFEHEYRLVLPDGSIRHLYIVGRPDVAVPGELEYTGVIMDVTERRHAEEALREARADLAHVSRVTTMGELTASLAHEVNQPITAAVTNANTCVRWLTGDTPNIEEARDAAMRSAKDGARAAQIISRIRLLFTKGITERELIDANEVIREMNVLLRGEATRYSISVRTELAPDLPQAMGDRVQLQQVMLNLIMNSIDAMKHIDGSRELTIKSQPAAGGQLLVSVSDTGVGLPSQQTDQIFNAFFTTKLEGTGMGLSISRSIVESHGGRLWAAGNSPRGATFYFTLPIKVGAE
jgi:PAS domain S-box-containing protein